MVPIMVLVFQTQKNEHPSYLFDIISNALSTGLPGAITTSFYLMLNMNTSEALFFHPLLLSGICSIIIFEIWNRLVLLKNKSLNVSD